jgi:hypothetical protein
LRREGRRSDFTHGYFEGVQVGKRIRGPFEEARLSEKSLVLALGVAAELEKPCDFTGRESEAMQSDEFLKTMHIHLVRAHGHLPRIADREIVARADRCPTLRDLR